MLLPLNIALKYMKSKKSSRFTSIISKSSIVGITIGIAVIITVLSIMNGFHSEMRNKILGMISHVIITGPDYELSNWQNIYYPRPGRSSGWIGSTRSKLNSSGYSWIFYPTQPAPRCNLSTFCVYWCWWWWFPRPRRGIRSILAKQHPVPSG